MPQTFTRFMRRVLLFLFPIFLLSGCGGGVKKPEGFPPLFPITITLTQDGGTLSNAMVLLVPDPEPGRWGSGGFTDAHGKAVIKTSGDFPGAPAGKYKVTVRKRDGEKGQGGNVTEYCLVDPLYESATTTPLTVEVGSGNKEATLDVGKAVRIKME